MHRRCHPLVLAGVLILASATPALADEVAKREPVARLVSESGTFLARETPEKPWHPLMKGQEILSGDLLIGLHDAALESKNGAVRVRTVTDLSNRSPFPIIETAIRLNADTTADLDVTLERGRIDVTNTKDSGAAKVVVRFRSRVWRLTLQKPGTRLAVEIYGRWPEGTRFRPGESADGPLTSFILIVLEGQVQRSCPLCSVAMTAPPGPAYFSWDSIHGDDTAARRLEKTPEWVEDLGPDQEETKRRLANRERFRRLLLDRGLDAALAFLLESKEPEVRRIGVYALGAFDRGEKLGELLATSKDPETWNNAVVALRHWMGREPGQDQLFYKWLTEKREVPPAQARTILDLLMGFSDLERARPELYSALIALLSHDRLAIRGLAYWHLRRLAPTVKVDYDPTATKENWAGAQETYKKAIPPGKLPPTE